MERRDYGHGSTCLCNACVDRHLADVTLGRTELDSMRKRCAITVHTSRCYSTEWNEHYRVWFVQQDKRNVGPVFYDARAAELYADELAGELVEAGDLT